jgi:hypothetical protein
MSGPGPGVALDSGEHKDDSTGALQARFAAVRQQLQDTERREHELNADLDQAGALRQQRRAAAVQQVSPPSRTAQLLGTRAAVGTARVLGARAMLHEAY